jgi:hypothetical protein
MGNSLHQTIATPTSVNHRKDVAGCEERRRERGLCRQRKKAPEYDTVKGFYSHRDVYATLLPREVTASLSTD